MSVFAISGLLIVLTSLVLIAILLIFGKTSLQRAWTFFNLGIFTWGIGTFMVATETPGGRLFLSWKLACLGGLLIAVFLYHTVYIFAELKNKLLLVAVYLQTIIYSLLAFFCKEGIVFGNWKLYFNSIYYFKTSLIYVMMALTWIAVCLLGLYELLKVIKRSQGLKKVQGKYLLYGLLIGFVGGGSVLLPPFGIKIYPLGNFGVVIYSLVGTYAVLRYRLMDASIAITRTGIFIAVYTLVLGLPFVFATNFRNRLIDVFGVNWWMLPLILMALLATIGPFIYIYVQRKAEGRLLKEQRRYQETLKHASVGMTRIRNLRKLLDLIAHIVTKTVRISYAGIYLYDRHANECVLQVSREKGKVSIPKLEMDNPLITWLALNQEPLIYEEVKRMADDSGDVSYRALEESMRVLGASVVIPSLLEDKFMGFFVLGDKKSGQIYTLDDLNVFEVLASQAALAIENAQFYEEAKEMHEQIAQAEKMATIGTMADGMSHQINNRFYALSLIAGDSIDTIKLTDTSKCSPEIKQMIDGINYALGRIQANVLQGGDVVRGLLKYSRKGDEGLEALKLDDIINNTLEMVQFKVKLSEIDLVRDFPADLPKIKGNMTQLNEAFFNFIDNANDAITERRVTLKEPGYRGKITISAKALDNFVEIVIQDNGMGIKDDNNKKIFTPFFTTKISSRKGTGLGLYVIRRIIIESHRGKIAFHSEHGVGTRFTLELPIAR